jgi:hypothetical protein
VIDEARHTSHGHADRATRIDSGSAGAPTGQQERERQKALRRLRKLRLKASAEINRLINFLDESDLDPDLEHTSDAEPSLCGVTVQTTSSDQDLEFDLGTFDRMIDQTKSTRITDGLGVADGEVECDDEPSLGSPLGFGFNDQRAWSARSDCENDPADSGIGDREGLLEQVGTEDCHQGGMG